MSWCILNKKNREKKKMKPILLINFKTYKEGTGRNALKLAKLCRIAEKKFQVILAVQPADIFPVSRLGMDVIAQHVDSFEQDRHTGAILPEDIRQEGAIGTLLNHSEHKIPFSLLKKTVERCKRIGLKTFVCAASGNEAKKVASLRPFAIASEVPELIATGNSISKQRPKSVRRFVLNLKRIGDRIIPLCGAGISNAEDVKAALQLGCKGVLVSSAIVKARNQKKAILSL